MLLYGCFHVGFPGFGELNVLFGILDGHCQLDYFRMVFKRLFVKIVVASRVIAVRARCHRVKQRVQVLVYLMEVRLARLNLQGGWLDPRRLEYGVARRALYFLDPDGIGHITPSVSHLSN